jgi:uncharacterized protein (TIGR00730 family)
VFCGSASGARTSYSATASELGALLAREGIELVYGGAKVGLMGAVADAALAAGGQVFGVLPEGLADRERAHAGLTELRVVGSMHERKATMAERADAFIALPGGFGTLEELFEMVTWAQLGLHRKPCAILDVDGYYSGLVAFLDRASGEGLLRPEHRAMLLVDDDPARLLARLRAYQAPNVPRWLRAGET